MEEHGKSDLDPVHVWLSVVEEDEDQRSAAHDLLLALATSLHDEGASPAEKNALRGSAARDGVETAPRGSAVAGGGGLVLRHDSAAALRAGNPAPRDSALGDPAVGEGAARSAVSSGRLALRHEVSGRPVIDGLAVSLSHARGLVAVAASRVGPIGVDVESRRDFEIDGMARRWFDPAEVTWLYRQPDPLDAFLRLWTAKEAVGKALGRGLRDSGLRRLMPLDTLLPTATESAPVPSEPGLAVLQLPVAAQAVLAIAVPSGVSEVRLTEHHGAALRSTVTSRTSFPVVVRGN